MRHRGNDGNFESALFHLIDGLKRIAKGKEAGRNAARNALQRWDYDRGYDWVVETKKSLGLLRNSTVNIVRLIANKSGDWRVLEVDGKIFHQGHSITESDWMNLIQMLGVEVIKVEVSDEEIDIFGSGVEI